MSRKSMRIAQDYMTMVLDWMALDGGQCALCCDGNDERGRKRRARIHHAEDCPLLPLTSDELNSLRRWAGRMPR